MRPVIDGRSISVKIARTVDLDARDVTRACDLLCEAARLLLKAAAGCESVRVDGAGFVVTVNLTPAAPK